MLSAYEHGRREPTVASLNRVLAAAGLSLSAEPVLGLRVVDPETANRELHDVLSFVDALPFSPRPETLAYPVFARR